MLQFMREMSGLSQAGTALGRGKRFALIAFFGLCFWTQLAMAQVNPPTANDLLQASPPGDASRAMFTAAIGDFFTNPLASLGAANTTLGAMLLIFNGFLFLLAVVWGTWGVFRGVVTSAHEGQVLGKNMSAVWMPIRMGTGLVSLVPAFGGYGLAQVVFVTSATMGIGAANMMFNQGINLVRSGAASSISLPMATGATGGANGVEQAAEALFNGYLCSMVYTANRASTGASDDISVATWNNDSTMGYSFSAPNAPSVCGQVLLRHPSSISTPSAFGFANGAVNYAGLQSATRTAHRAALERMRSSAQTLAQTWAAARQTAMNSGAEVPPIPVPGIKQLSTEYITTVTTTTRNLLNGQNGNSTAISNAVVTQMSQRGWMGLGAWYTTFAEVNNSISDAVKGMSYDVTPLQLQYAPVSVQEEMAALGRSFANAIEANPQGLTTGTSSGDGFAPMKGMLCKAIDSSATATGDCSIGQAIVRWGIKGAAGDTGPVDPIIMMKNLGDYMMWTSQVIMIGVEWMTEKLDSWAAKLVVKAAGKAPGWGWLAEFGASAVKAMMKLALMAAQIMLGFGVLMAIYIPLVPFITWFGALTSYVVTIIEGLVGSAIGALAHMEAEGEGMGQRTEKAYLFLLNAALRPGLMVIGFFAAMSLLPLMAGLLRDLYIPAIANSQGNSVTGLISIGALLAIFFLLNNTLIQGMFNMVYILPDQVLGIIGIGHSEKLGREENARGSFMAGFGKFEAAVARPKKAQGA